MTSDLPGAQLEELELFYHELRNAYGHPLWLQTSDRGRTIPFLWRYKDFRPLLIKAMDVVPIELANRRALFMANPGLKDQKSATSTLLANLQVIKPGEVAPSHRHSASALRFVLEGKGAFTSVEGEKSYMEPGDFVTTPNWTWHDHGHEGEGPMIWLDGLDQPIVECFEAWFWESYEKEIYPVTKPNEVSQRMYGSGSMRPTWTHYASATVLPAPDYHRDSPLVNYKYAQAREMLFALAHETDGSPYDGCSVEYTNPVSGGPVFATMACFSQLLREGQHTKAHRHVGSVVYHVVEGKGHTIIDGVKFAWEDKDTFVVPGWAFHEHVGESEAVMFSYTDTPITQSVGLYREEAYIENGGHQKVTATFKAGPKS